MAKEECETLPTVGIGPVARSASAIRDASSVRCLVCGESEFAAGPGGRLALGKPPQCCTCGSLERHRAMHALLTACRPLRASAWRCLTLGETMRPQSKLFRETVSGAGGRYDVGDEPFDIIAGVGHFERTTEDTISAVLLGLSSCLKQSGLLAFAHATSPPPPRTSRRQNGGWTVGADFGCLAARALPEFSILGLRIRDEPTGVLGPVTVLGLNEGPLVHLAARVQSAGGTAEFISI